MRMLLLGRRVSIKSSSSITRNPSRSTLFTPLASANGRRGDSSSRGTMSGPAAAADADNAAAAAVAQLAGRPPLELSPELWRLLADSHAHPQLADYGGGDETETDAAAAFSAAAASETARQTLERASAARLACMSVGAGVDWDRVEALAELDAGRGRIVPAFGIHPWWAHLHGAAGREQEGAASGGGDEGAGRADAAAASAEEEEGMRSLLEAPDEAEMQAALQSVARAAAEGRLGLYGGGGEQREEEEEGAGEGGGGGGGGGDPAANPHPPVAPIPRSVWEPRLRALLERHPTAIVGEAGLDRAAVIPGTKRARCSQAHQLALLRAQLSLAAGLARPVSLHCVRAHGAMYDELRARALASAKSALADPTVPIAAEATLPPRVMLHSFGGSPEEAARLSALEALSGRAGARVYFSFSAAINQRVDPAKLAARIRAVPDDRLLLESDEVAPGALDEGLARSLALVAAARGWALGEAAARCRDNFEAFYGVSGRGD